jgi:hypothetical protein
VEKSSQKNFKKFTVEDNHKEEVSDFKFERDTLTRAASKKLQGFEFKLADSARGVAPDKYPKPIIVNECATRRI